MLKKYKFICRFNIHKTSFWATRIIMFGVLAFTLSTQLIQNVSAAGIAHLSLVTKTNSYNINETLSATIHVNSTDEINFVEADLSYDKAKLQFVDLDKSQSAFDMQIPNNNGDGTVKVSVAKQNTSLSGDQIVVDVNFKVLVGSGSTTLSFIDKVDPITLAHISSQVRTINNTEVWDGNTTGGTYTLTGAPAPSSGNNSTTTGNNSTSTGSNSTSTTGNNSSSNTQNKTGTSTGTGSTGGTGSTNNQSGVTGSSAGYTSYYVAIVVTGSNKKLVNGAKVTLDNKPPAGYTNGVASYNSVSEGTHTLVVQTGNKKITKTITVKSGSLTDVQKFDVKIPSGMSTTTKIILVVSAILLLIIIIGGGTGLTRVIQRRRQMSWVNPANQADYNTIPITPPPDFSTPNLPVGQSVEPEVIHPEQEIQNQSNNNPQFISGSKGL